VLDKLAEVDRRYEELGHLMSQPEALGDRRLLEQYAREHADLGDVVTLYRELLLVNASRQDARSLLQESDDPELKQLAEETLQESEERHRQLLESLQRALVPKDPNDDRNVIIEIRAAAGGEEAALFAAELYRMYNLFAEQHRWHVELLDLSETGIGGIKEVIFKVNGKGAYGRFKYESGVHRVQRIPVTESGGRIHTSTATVMVLPEAEEVDVQIRPEDLRIDVYRSSGHGGQSVNTTDSAVRITHLPTGMVVTCQNERSQLKNKASALSVLRARLLAAEQEKRDKELGDVRRSQVQTGDRSEKIRTYNFPQDRLTDHRINLTVHNLPSILNGGIGAVIERLAETDQGEKLRATV
jgi:peptide chain release factor 1